VRKGGAEAFREVLAQRTSPVEYLIGLIYLRHVDKGADGLAMASREAVEVLLGVRDATRRDSYARQVADRWGQRNPARTEAIERVLREELQRRRAQQGPTARVRNLSPRDRGFITETVAQHAAAVPPGILELERELLATALRAPELTGRLLAALEGDDFTLPVHVRVYQAIGEAFPGSVADFTAAWVVAKLAGDEEGQALAVELSMGGSGEVDEEVLTHGLAKIRHYRSRGGHRPRDEVAADGDQPAPEPVEDYEELRRWVAQQLNDGTLDPADERYQRYKALMVRSHGKGSGD
jgi:DNA primase